MFNLEKYLSFELLYICIFNLVFFGFFLVLWRFIFNHDVKINQIQNTHETQSITPRIGGLLIILGISFWNFYEETNLSSSIINLIILYSIPFFVIAFFEDIKGNVKPLIRFFSIFLSSLFFALFSGFSLPIIEIPFIGTLINNTWISFIFFAFALSIVSNGVNLIDGSNGLAAMTVLTGFSCLAYISYISNDLLTYSTSLAFGGFIVIFLLLNFPWGYVFLGDSGAYFLGFALGALTIIFYSRHPDIPNWGAILILFYPSMEVLFSFMRKILINRNPFQPDPDHLHLRLFWILQFSIKKKRVANGCVMPLLSIIWMSPIVLLPWVYKNLILIILSIIILTIIYLGFYWSLSFSKHNIVK